MFWSTLVCPDRKYGTLRLGDVPINPGQHWNQGFFATQPVIFWDDYCYVKEKKVISILGHTVFNMILRNDQYYLSEIQTMKCFVFGGKGTMWWGAGLSIFALPGGSSDNVLVTIICGRSVKAPRAKDGASQSLGCSSNLNESEMWGAQVVAIYGCIWPYMFQGWQS